MTLRETYTPMIDALQKQATAYRDMTALAQQQIHLLDAGDAEQLTDVLTRKRSLMESVEQLKQEMQPLTEDWASDRDNAEPALREEIEQAVQGVREILKQLLELENSFSRKVAGQRDQAAGEIQQVQRSRKAAQAYGQKPEPPSGPRFMDTSE